MSETRSLTRAEEVAIVREMLRWLSAAAVLFCVSPAIAEEKADALFDRGLKAFLAGDHATGCPLIARSYEIDPLPGVLFTLAECQRGWGKVKSAADNYAAFLDKIRSLPPNVADKHAERAAVALKNRAEAAKQIPSLRVSVRGRWVPGSRVRLGDLDLTLSLAKPVQLDPGPYTLVLEQPGRPRQTRRLAIAASDHAEVELALEAEPEPEARPEPAQPAPARRDTKPAGPVLPWLLVGVGAAGVVTGSVTGLLAASEASTVDHNCPNRTCNAEGRDALERAQRFGAISTVSFGVGVVAGGIGLYMLATRPKQEAARSNAPRVSLTFGQTNALVITRPF